MNGTLLDLFGVIAASTGLLGAAVNSALALFLPYRATCGVCSNNLVKQFSKRNDGEKHIMLTDEDSKGGEPAP